MEVLVVTLPSVRWLILVALLVEVALRHSIRP